jgi:hypothetical protein
MDPTRSLHGLRGSVQLSFLLGVFVIWVPECGWLLGVALVISLRHGNADGCRGARVRIEDRARRGLAGIPGSSALQVFGPLNGPAQVGAAGERGGRARRDGRARTGFCMTAGDGFCRVRVAVCLGCDLPGLLAGRAGRR